MYNNPTLIIRGREGETWNFKFHEFKNEREREREMLQLLVKRFLLLFQSVGCIKFSIICALFSGVTAFFHMVRV